MAETKINLVNSATVAWSAGAPYVDPSDPQGAPIRDVEATATSIPVNWRGAWNSGTSYAIGDGVSLSGSSYLCISANTNQSPPNATYWGVLAQSMAVAGDLGGTLTSPKVVGIQGVGVSATSPTNGQALVYNSSSGLWVPGSVGGGSGSAIMAPVGIGTGTNSGWQNYTLWVKISGLALLSFPASWTVKMQFHSGSPVIGAMVVLRTLVGSLTVIDSTTVKIGGNAAPTLSSPGLVTTDAISLALDSSHDYYFMIFLSNVSANASVAVNTGSGGPPVAYTSGNQTGVSTIPSGTANQYLFYGAYNP